MNYQDYIDFQTLLAKLRVNCLKILAIKSLKTNNRDKVVKIIRSIDYLRENTVLLEEENATEAQLTKEEAEIWFALSKNEMSGGITNG